MTESMNDEQFLVFAMKGDMDAVRLVKAIVQVAGVWDDLIDKDKPVSDEDINTMMWNALVAIPTNPFYTKVGALLQPLFQVGILNWHLSNEMRKEPGRSREIAHVARYSAGDVALYMMALIGGVEWVRAHGAQMKLRMQREDFRRYDSEQEAANEKST
jgi:hypothetical protein